MSYKYHERAMVLNERNLIRCWDVAFNGYNGGNDDRVVHFNNDKEVYDFRAAVHDVSRPYNGASIMVMSFTHDPSRRYANPLCFQNPELGSSTLQIDPEKVHACYDPSMELIKVPQGTDARRTYFESHLTGVNRQAIESYKRWKDYSEIMPPFRQLSSTDNAAGQNSHDEVTATSALAFQGTCKVAKWSAGSTGPCDIECFNGSGHLGESYVGVASVREGKGMFFNPGANNNVLMRPI